MKLMIEIPEEDYIRLRDEGMFGNVTTFKRAVREGIPLEQEPCDAVSRKEVMNMLHNHAFDYATSTKILALLKTMCGEVDRMPSVIPQYTEAEIQKMQELEQAEIQKAYEIGKEEGSSEKPNKWIPVSERLPELNRPLLVTAYHRVYYGHLISESGNYGYPVFRIHGLGDKDRNWVQETMSHAPYSLGRIDAWMYFDIPEPYKASPTGAESEGGTQHE